MTTDTGAEGDVAPLLSRSLGSSAAVEVAAERSSSEPSTLRRASLFLRFLTFTVAFSLAETAVVASISVASSLLGRYGSLSVGALYATFAVGTLFAGSVVRASGGNLRPLLLVSVAGMGLFNVACLVAAVSAGRLEEVEGGGKVIPLSQQAGYLLVLTSAIAGLADGMIWPAVGTYLTFCAQAMSVSDKEENDGGIALDYGALGEKGGYDAKGKKASPTISAISRRLDGALPRAFHVLAGYLQGIFNSVFLALLFLGHLYTAYAFRTDDYKGALRAYGQIAIMTAVAVAVMYLAMAPRKAEVESQTPDGCMDCPGCHGGNPPAERPPPMKETVNPVTLAIGLTFAEPALYYLVPSHIAYGLIDGLVLGYVARHLVPGPSAVGILATIKTVVAAGSAPILTSLGSGDTTRSSRTAVVSGGNIAYLAVVVLVGINLLMGTGGSNGEGLSDVWVWSNLVLIYVLDGLGFAAWQTTTSGALLSEIAPALVGGGDGYRERSYENPAEVTSAVFAGCKAVSGAATAAAFFMSPILPGYAIVSIGIVAAVAGYWAIGRANRRNIFQCSNCGGWSFAHHRGSWAGGRKRSAPPTVELTSS